MAKETKSTKVLRRQSPQLKSGQKKNMSKKAKVLRRSPKLKSGQKNMAKEAKSTKGLPMEIIEQVLKHSPVKGLVRFRCLSKQLCREIDSEGFAKAHLSQSKKTRSHRKFVGASPICCPPDERGIFVRDFVPLKHPLETISSWGDPFELPEDCSFIRPEDCSFKCVGTIYGSCNGLILLSSCGKDHDSCNQGFLWLLNPSTRRCKKVEPCPRNSDKGSWFGFGYDSIGDDYKFVHILRPLDTSPTGVEIWVYSFASNTWGNRILEEEEITFDFDPYYCQSQDRIGAFADGALHWFLLVLGKNMFVSFDLSKEKFVDLILSLELKHFFGSLHSLQGYGGESQLVYIDGAEVLHVAVKSEQGKTYTWRNFRNLDIATYTRVLDRPEDYKLMLATSNSTEGTFHEFRHMKTKSKGSRSCGFGKAATFCWESLVWPRQEDEQLGEQEQ